MKASQVKRGIVIKHNNSIYAVRDVEKSVGTARSAATTFRLTLFAVVGGQKLDLSLRADDELEDVAITKRNVVFSYLDADSYVFMDEEDYSQYSLDRELIADLTGFIIENTPGYVVSLLDDAPIALQVPNTVTLEIVDTAPEMKGASATKRNKPATLNTGIEVQIPEYIGAGEKIKVNTDTKEYLGRA